MSTGKGYWDRKLISRRHALRAAAAGAGGLVALSLIGCSDDDDSDDSGSSGGSGSEGQSGATQTPSDGQSAAEPKAGGSLKWQGTGHPGTFDLFASSAAGAIGSLVHSTLVASTIGRPPSNGVDVDVEPDLAEALPEQQPDGLTYVYKLRDATFHNGKEMTSEDVKYSWERYAFFEDSIFRKSWLWLDKVEAPDPKTFVITTKAPNADAVLIPAFQISFILDQAHIEGPEVAAKQIGTGPFLFSSSNSGAETILKKNPDYYNQPFPYFDEIVALPAADTAKQVADFSAKNTHFTYWFGENPRDELRKTRPDATEWFYNYAGFTMHIRNDQPPFNDKRVRQALSMSIDREAIRAAVSKGEGEDDQVFSPAMGPKWGFRKPSELPSAKNWTYDPEAAKQLLSAAGVSLPITGEFTHLDSSLRGSIDTDLATLTQAGWKQLGIAEIADKTVTPGQFYSTIAIGDFNGMTIGVGLQQPVLGTQLKDYFYSPDNTAPNPPTLNWSRVNNTRVNELFDKQLTQFDFEERRTSFQELEEIFGEEMFVIPWSTTSHTHFTDPSLTNCVVPVYPAATNAHYLRFWAFK